LNYVYELFKYKNNDLELFSFEILIINILLIISLGPIMYMHYIRRYKV